MIQTCPLCKLVSPPSAIHCDCGYDFQQKRLDNHKIPRQPNHTDTIQDLGYASFAIRGVSSIIAGIFMAIWGLQTSIPWISAVLGLPMIGIGIVLLTKFIRNLNR